MFGHIWERFWTFLKIWKFFDFFEFFLSFDPPRCTGQKFFFEKITSKHVLNMFGHIWERFWTFLKI